MSDDNNNDNWDDRMTGQELVEARAELGRAWGLGRPLFAAELGRILRMGGRDPGESVRDWERDRSRMPGPVGPDVRHRRWPEAQLPSPPRLAAV
jgi:hypothetical protein